MLQGENRAGKGQNCVAALGDLGNSIINGAAGALGNIVPGKMETNKKKDLITQLATQMKIEPEVAFAFAKVESGGALGRSSYVNGKVIIRFEENHMFVDIEKGNIKQFGLDVGKFPFYSSNRQEMTNKWFELGKQYGWSKKHDQDGDYKALSYLVSISEQFAYQCISTGTFQIMGVNYRMFGYQNAKQMYESFASSEEMQIRGFFTFVSKKGGGKCLAALQQKDFKTAAGYYNGFSTTQQDKYASKLQSNYEQYKNQGIA